MSTPLDKPIVAKVAKLAKIQLTEAELERYSGDLGKILHVVNSLMSVDTSGVEPTLSVSGVVMNLREDVVTEQNIRDKILANAASQHGYFAVPKVIE